MRCDAMTVIDNFTLIVTSCDKLAVCQPFCYFFDPFFKDIIDDPNGKHILVRC